MGKNRRLTAPSILLVEDNPLHVRLVASMLAEVWPGFEDLHEARRLDRAVDYLGRETPDCVLLDLVLPDADGLEAVNVILAANPEVPVVVLSSHDDPELALRAVGEGAQDYLVKGAVDPAELARAIKFAIQRHGTRFDRESGELVPFPIERVTIEDVAVTEPAAYAVVDGDGVLRHVSEEAAALIGRPLYDLIGAAIEDLVDPEDIEGWRSALADGTPTELSFSVEDGDDIAAGVELHPLCGADGVVDATVISLTPLHRGEEDSKLATVGDTAE